jgi:hypothetical protein
MVERPLTLQSWPELECWLTVKKYSVLERTDNTRIVLFVEIIAAEEKTVSKSDCAIYA